MIQKYINVVGVYIFAFGFIAAALSSMLTVPLGAALTADRVFGKCQEEVEVEEVPEGAEHPAYSKAVEEQETVAGEITENDTPATPTHAMPASPTKLVPKTEDENEKTRDIKISIEEPSVLKTLPRSIYLAIMTVMVSIAVIVISCDGK